MFERKPSTSVWSRRRVRTRPEPPDAPEWTTERWKHKVEAEARGRLKKDVRDVGAQPPRSHPVK